MSAATGTSRRPHQEGDSIASIFTSLSGEIPEALPPRFSALKKEIWRDDMVQTWREVLEELEVATEEVAQRGSDMIPKVDYKDIQAGVSEQVIKDIKRTGTVVVTGAVPSEEVLGWKEFIRDYADVNREKLRGFPADNIQVYELYNSIPQLQARTHPAIIDTQRFLLSLWHASDPSTPVSLSTPISYFDRLRIRLPGDSKFALGPHVDGGSLEQWEDPKFRSCWDRILRRTASTTWRDHDPYDVTPRIGARHDLYENSNKCSIFRPWQGWTAMSSTGPGEGTLRVLPLLSLATTYIILRPFFRPKFATSTSLKFEDWEVDLEGTAFPGSVMGKTQELNEKTHPHLRLDRTMVSAPRVEPGDQVYWHCDGIHAVESQHRGQSDSSVLYIPAVPLTEDNARYLKDQRQNFLLGLPAPDFPGGEGESKFVGRARPEHIATVEGRRMFGLQKFDTSDDPTGVIRRSNEILFG